MFYPKLLRALAMQRRLESNSLNKIRRHQLNNLLLLLLLLLTLFHLHTNPNKKIATLIVVFATYFIPFRFDSIQ